MPDADLIDLFVAPLNRAGLAYMVTGSVASMLYAEPRFTADVDIVVRLASPDDLRGAFAATDYGLLAAQGERLDYPTLERFAAERGVAGLLAEIRSGPAGSVSP